MCFAIPYKVIKRTNDHFKVKNEEEKREIENALVEVGEGDYVMLQQNTIIKKIPKKEAEKTLELLNLSN